MGPTDFESETLPLLSQVEARLTGQKASIFECKIQIVQIPEFLPANCTSLDSAVESQIQNTKLPGLNPGWGPINTVVFCFDFFPCHI